MMVPDDIALRDKSYTKTEDGKTLKLTVHELYHADALLWRKESCEITTPNGKTYGAAHTAVLSKNKRSLTVGDAAGTAPQVIDIQSLLEASFGARHASGRAFCAVGALGAVARALGAVEARGVAELTRRG